MIAKSFLIFGLAAIGSSFSFPDDLPNGSYRAYYNEAGEEVHELIEASVFNSTSSLPALPKRQYSQSKRDSIQTWCGCDNSMNAGDTNVANAGLADQAAAYPTIWPGTAFYTIQNTAVAFVCNVDDKSANIPTDVVSTGSWDISAACGLFYAGTSRIQWPEALDYGYMNYAPGLEFCQDAEESTSSTCQVNFWIGGFSGEFEAGAVDEPSDDNEVSDISAVLASGSAQ
ncbi:hypothetical protein N7510_000276 [Penicillium lagena]|uniref:uncharacterized protein n=1 Tax=Penicillium lagena TaxID=94218 RepID=UPI002540B874|nr:uncharacterized protein N7510_000276 [Penicillium lagena]KAJ5623967.1 hypothetical protein N7510_000276 [Penicillium lagena]